MIAEDKLCGICSHRDPAGTGRRWCGHYQADLEGGDAPFTFLRCEACVEKGRPQLSRQAAADVMDAFRLFAAKSLAKSGCSSGCCPTCGPRMPPRKD